eukprot:TRINITY_DN21120_c0_g1_i1.p1 TRINITY_DN21120_c0_g1~~TRINITY_DN21120_c0_g1_i1.p1  ORF type:complete len:184 (+),score=9.64 TRINITY_DN21120_c0_g1_i1:55-606(+)
MGCGASAQTGPFTQVLPVDHAEPNSKHHASLKKDEHLVPHACNGKTQSGRLVQSFIINADIEPEPANSVSFKSYCFEPSPDNCVPGQRITPCAPSHRRHLTRMNYMLRLVRLVPKGLEAIVKERRELFDREAKLRDAVELEERRRLRTLLLKEQQELFEQQKIPRSCFTRHSSGSSSTLERAF